MLEINVSKWANWDQMVDYIGEMHKAGITMTLKDIPQLFEWLYSDELSELGLNVHSEGFVA